MALIDCLRNDMLESVRKGDSPHFLILQRGNGDFEPAFLTDKLTAPLVGLELFQGSESWVRYFSVFDRHGREEAVVRIKYPGLPHQNAFPNEALSWVESSLLTQYEVAQMGALGILQDKYRSRFLNNDVGAAYHELQNMLLKWLNLESPVAGVSTSHGCIVKQDSNPNVVELYHFPYGIYVVNHKVINESPDYYRFPVRTSPVSFKSILHQTFSELAIHE